MPNNYIGYIGWIAGSDSSSSSSWIPEYNLVSYYSDPNKKMAQKMEQEMPPENKMGKEVLWHEVAKGKKRIEVFDFDDTIVQSAKRPERGKPRHGWNGKDWWGSKASLSEPFFSVNRCAIHEPVVDAMIRATQDEDTLAILLTGRRGVVAYMVRGVLRIFNMQGKRIIPSSNGKAIKSHQARLSSGEDTENHLHGNAYHHQFFCGDFVTEDDYPKNSKGKPQHGTIYHKTYIVQKLMHESIEELVMWDDRDDHIRPFIAMGLDLKRKYEKLESATINRVFPIRDNDGRNNCIVMSIPIKRGMSY